MPDINVLIDELVFYAFNHMLIEERDMTWATNRVLDYLKLDRYDKPTRTQDRDLEAILTDIVDWAVETGRCDPGPASRDLYDSGLMGIFVPRPSYFAEKFWYLYDQDRKNATDWYYQYCQDIDYIRTYRVARDMKWVTRTAYGDLDITVNLSKPEKDPKAIAAAKNAPQDAYPKCQLCAENEGYAGRLDHPGRSNHRPIALFLDSDPWFFQYSPYVYYNEHCILFNSQHIPMKIDRGTFRRALTFVGMFPHYFVGSNADLPIVGGSILSHDHFQGGHYTFAMEKAPIERITFFEGFEDVHAGIVRWPMSVIRLRSADPTRLVDLAENILNAWRGYTDEDAFIFAQTNGEPHNTITPIARRRGEDYELDLVLRNNITTEEFPLGVYHPHQDLHHIKKENIGLIEVMGLAVLPARLKDELALLAQVLVEGGDPAAHESIAKHAPWAQELKTRHTFTSDNALSILQEEVGQVFARVLEDAGVYKCTPEGREAFQRFISSVK